MPILLIACNNPTKVENKNISKDTITKSTLIISDTARIITDRINNNTLQSKIVDTPKVSTNPFDNAHTDYKENSKKMKLNFKAIDFKSFEFYKKNYDLKIQTDTTKTAKRGESFILNTSHAIYKFPCELHCYYYAGYSKPLRSHLIWDSRDVSQLFLLDSITGESYLINEDGSNPFISKNERQLITYSSSEFEHITFITLYKRDDLSSRFDFSKCDSYMTENWLIRELVWIDENSFALKVYDKIDFDNKGKDFVVNERYLKATIMR